MANFNEEDFSTDVFILELEEAMQAIGGGLFFLLHLQPKCWCLSALPPSHQDEEAVVDF